MKYYSINELATNTATIYEDVRSNGSVVITNGDRPEFLMLDIGNNDYETFIDAISRARAFANLESMREIAAQNGYMTDEEIEAEIQAARQERRNREGRNCHEYSRFCSLEKKKAKPIFSYRMFSADG